MEIFTYYDYIKYKPKISNKINILEDNSEKYYLYKKINNEHDKIFRKILTNKKELILFLNNFFKLNEKILEKNIEEYKNWFITIQFENQEADIVYKLKDKEIFFLIEHQTKIDYSMPFRILRYEVEIIQSYISKTLMNRKNFIYPLIIPIVIYTGRKKWNAKTYLNTLKNEYSKYRGIKLAQYNLIDVNNYKNKKLLEENSILTKLMLIEKSKNHEELLNNLEKIINKLIIDKNYFNKNQIELFKNIFKYIIGNKIKKNKKIELLKKLEGEKNMLAVIEMLQREDLKPINVGMKKGIKEGRKEGRKETILKICKKLLEKNYSMEEIKEITNLSEEEIKKIAKK